ncbi:MAG TPA: hypothetical protein VFC78_21950 [Tepidisphaeraceae bacterium]|nr:hypothetical protein [Tepidisphaeraceae bacterium]
MGLRLQRALGGLTLAIFLLASFRCACANPLLVPAAIAHEQHADADCCARDCCAGEHKDCGKPDHAPAGRHDCQHCLQTVIAESAKSHFAVNVTADIFHGWAIQPSLIDGAPVAPTALLSRIAGDQPPPHPAGTLLNLHCALTL